MRRHPGDLVFLQWMLGGAVWFFVAAVAFLVVGPIGAMAFAAGVIAATTKGHIDGFAGVVSGLGIDAFVRAAAAPALHGFWVLAVMLAGPGLALFIANRFAQAKQASAQ